MTTLNTTILQNLLNEREFAIAKITVTTQRLERLEEQIAEQRRVIERENEEKKL